MRRKAWILVANKDKARILRVEKVGVFEEVDDLIDPEAKNRHTITNANVGDNPGHNRHAWEPHTQPHEKEASNFAKLVAQRLEKARQDGAYESLYLVAEPKFLGYLRQALHPNTSQLVAGECPKDLVLESPQDLWEHLPFAI